MISYDVLLPLGYVFAGVDRSRHTVYEVASAGLSLEEVVGSEARGRGTGLSSHACDERTKSLFPPNFNVAFFLSGPL